MTTPTGAAAVARPSGAGGAARTAAVVALAEIVGKVATLVATVVAARALAPATFGAFAYALALGVLLQALPTLGFDTVLIRQAARDPERLPLRLAENLVWRVTLGLPVFAAGYALASGSRPDGTARLVLALVLAATLLDLHDQAWRAGAAAQRRQAAVFVALVAQRLAAGGLAVGVLLAGGGVVGLAVAHLAASVAGTLLLLVVARRIGLRADLRGVRWSGLVAAGRGSVVVGIYAVVSSMLFRVDTLVLEALRGDVEVAVYAAAARIVETVLFVSWAVSRATFPAMAADPEPGRVGRLVTGGVAAVALVYGPVAVVALIAAPDVLGLLFGAQYAATAAPALRALALAPIGYGLGFLAARGLVALGAERAALAATAAAVVLDVALAFLLAPSLGAVGTALATSAAYALQAVVVVALLRRRTGPLRLLRATAEPVLATVTMALVLVALRAAWTPPLLVQLAIAGTCAAGVWYAAVRRWSPDKVALIASMVPARRARPA